MSHAGIDCGTTLVKAFWTHGTAERSVAAQYGEQVNDLIGRLKSEGVRRVRLIGTGIRHFPRTDFDAADIAPGISDEIALQADGARWLLARNGSILETVLVAAVGTGISYAYVPVGGVERMPLGSAHGGGTVMGLARLLGITDFETLSDAALRGTAPDLHVKDAVPEMAGTSDGDLIIAHFAKSDASRDDLCAGIFSFSAASVFKDLAIACMVRDCRHIAIVGTLGCSVAFRAHFERFIPHLPNGISVTFLEKGAYAGAIGAWLAG